MPCTQPGDEGDMVIGAHAAAETSDTSEAAVGNRTSR